MNIEWIMAFLQNNPKINLLPSKAAKNGRKWSLSEAWNSLTNVTINQPLALSKLRKFVCLDCGLGINPDMKFWIRLVTQNRRKANTPMKGP